MNKLLLIIDVQNDFINENTIDALDKIKNLISTNNYNLIAFTRFINDKDSIWYNKLHYKGCMSENGKQIAIDTNNNKVFDKKTYTAVNEELKKFICDNKINQIYLCGFDTDACVQKTALDLFEQDYDVFILKDYCMSSAGLNVHNLYIENMKRLIGEDRIL